MKRIITSAFIILLAIGSAQAQDAPSRDREGHRKEHKKGFEQLNLSDDQKSRLQAIREDFKKGSEELKNTAQLSTEEKQARRKELHQQFRSQSEAVLTPSQKEQLSKMKADRKTTYKAGKGKWNKSGEARKSAGKNFQQELGLNAEQQQKISNLRSEFRPKMEALRNETGLTKEQKKAKMMELKKQQQEQMKALLTPEQIQKMEAMRKQRSNKK
jgi:Spy/CpxP family protein refolding chaperone